MIRRISIKNYALIRDLTIEPGEGLNIITGETGAGKSIILGALALLQGKRADTKALSSQSEKSEIEAEFVLADGKTVVLRREILPSGRSKVFIDGVPAQFSDLAGISESLIDIHSQHQNLQLTDPSFQLETIDKIAGNSELLEEYHKTYREYRTALTDFVRTRDEFEKTGNDKDYLEFLMNEFDTIELDAAEDENLEQLVETLRNKSEIAESLSQAAMALSWSEASAANLISEAAGLLRSATEISDRLSPLLERIENIKTELSDLTDAISEEADVTGCDSRTLQDMENRLDRINALKNKHKTATVSELIAVRDALSDRLDNFRNSETTLKELERKARNLKKQALTVAAQLSEKRKVAADLLVRDLMERARPLGMENLIVKINVTQGKLNPDGIDTVEFLFAFNKNQEPVAGANRASGGELSRVMLALKSITVEHRLTPTIIFDEIDTGVSGDVANRMGRLMAIIGRHIQVISITHLPQIAAKGLKHFKVFKRDDESSTRTFISELSHNERIDELALMLSGDTSDSAALATAENLLNNK